MPKTDYKKPSLEHFRDVVNMKGANLSEVARSLGVTRATVWRWTQEDNEFKSALIDARKRFFDGILQNSVLLATGVPAYETVMDSDGNPETDERGRPKKKFAGWIERPDGNMARWLMSKLGDDEGFGEEPMDKDVPVNGVPIASWIRRENETNSSPEN